MSIWNILQAFGIFHDHLVPSVFIWYIFTGLGNIYQEKNLATLLISPARPKSAPRFFSRFLTKIKYGMNNVINVIVSKMMQPPAESFLCIRLACKINIFVGRKLVKAKSNFLDSSSSFLSRSSDGIRITLKQISVYVYIFNTFLSNLIIL
jgi:hypothetical protein